MIRRTHLPEPPAQKLQHSHEKDVDKELKLIYQDEHGETPDLSKLDVRRQSRLKRLMLWMFFTILVLGSVTWSGYLVFQKTFTPSQKTLQMIIDGPKDVISGEKTTFDIRYENTGDVPLAFLETKLNLPEGFQLRSTDPPMSSPGNVWTIGSVTAGSDGLIHIEGIWTDVVPSGSTIQAISTYRPANFNADFQDIVTHAVTINSSVITLTADTPTTAVPGVEATYIYHLTNTGTEPLEHARVRLELPTTLLVSTSTPTLNATTTEWQIDTLAPKETLDLQLTGVFTADTAGSQTIVAEAGIMRNQTFLSQTNTEHVTDVLGGDVSLRLIVNGSTSSQTVAPGKPLTVSIDATNNGNGNAEGVSMELVITSGSEEAPIDWENANLAGGVRSGSSIYWGGSALSQKGLLPANGRETIDLFLPLLSAPGAESFSLSVIAHLDTVAGKTTNQFLQSTPLTIALATDIDFDVRGLYYQEGTPVGSGSLPPAVGQTTTYRLFWSIGDAIHAVDDVMVRATLPMQVTFVGQKEGQMGTLTFDETTRTLTWKINRLPAHAGEVLVSFDLSINPTVSDVGTFVTLLSESHLTGTDDITNSSIQYTDDVITTEIPDDPDAAGKGSVSE